MSEYQQARSRPGAVKHTGADDRELFLVEFGEMVLEAWEESNTYGSLTFTKTIQRGKAESFPIIGRKRDAAEHEPGEVILGGHIEHNERVITLDKMLVDAAFIAEVDELMAHYDLARPYARQLGESLGTTTDRRIAIQHIIASRVTEEDYTDAPLPGRYLDNDVDTSAVKLEEAAFKAVEHIKERDIGGGPLSYRVPWQQYLLCARSGTFEGGPVTTGSADRSRGSVGLIAGIPMTAHNHIPNTNITTGLVKYRGDFSKTIGHISNEMAVGTLRRRGLKVVMKEQDDRLGTLLIASVFQGHGVLRPECSFEVGLLTGHPME